MKAMNLSSRVITSASAGFIKYLAAKKARIKLAYRPFSLIFTEAPEDGKQAGAINFYLTLRFAVNDGRLGRGERQKTLIEGGQREGARARGGKQDGLLRIDRPLQKIPPLNKRMAGAKRRGDRLKTNAGGNKARLLKGEDMLMHSASALSAKSQGNGAWTLTAGRWEYIYFDARAPGYEPLEAAFYSESEQKAGRAIGGSMNLTAKGPRHGGEKPNRRETQSADVSSFGAWFWGRGASGKTYKSSEQGRQSQKPARRNEGAAILEGAKAANSRKLNKRLIIAARSVGGGRGVAGFKADFSSHATLTGRVLRRAPMRGLHMGNVSYPVNAQSPELAAWTFRGLQFDYKSPVKKTAGSQAFFKPPIDIAKMVTPLCIMDTKRASRPAELSIIEIRTTNRPGTDSSPEEISKTRVVGKSVARPAGLSIIERRTANKPGTDGSPEEITKTGVWGKITSRPAGLSIIERGIADGPGNDGGTKAISKTRVVGKSASRPAGLSIIERGTADGPGTDGSPEEITKTGVWGKITSRPAGLSIIERRTTNRPGTDGSPETILKARVVGKSVARPAVISIIERGTADGTGAYSSPEAISKTRVGCKSASRPAGLSIIERRTADGTGAYSSPEAISKTRVGCKSASRPAGLSIIERRTANGPGNDGGSLEKISKTGVGGKSASRPAGLFIIKRRIADGPGTDGGPEAITKARVSRKSASRPAGLSIIERRTADEPGTGDGPEEISKARVVSKRVERPAGLSIIERRTANKPGTDGGREAISKALVVGKSVARPAGLSIIEGRTANRQGTGDGPEAISKARVVSKSANELTRRAHQSGPDAPGKGAYTGQNGGFAAASADNGGMVGEAFNSAYNLPVSNAPYAANGQSPALSSYGANGEIQTMAERLPPYSESLEYLQTAFNGAENIKGYAARPAAAPRGFAEPGDGGRPLAGNTSYLASREGGLIATATGEGLSNARDGAKNGSLKHSGRAVKASEKSASRLGSAGLLSWRKRGYGPEQAGPARSATGLAGRPHKSGIRPGTAVFINNKRGLALAGRAGLRGLGKRGLTQMNKGRENPVSKRLAAMMQNKEARAAGEWTRLNMDFSHAGAALVYSPGGGQTKRAGQSKRLGAANAYGEKLTGKGPRALAGGSQEDGGRSAGQKAGFVPGGIALPEGLDPTGEIRYALDNGAQVTFNYIDGPGAPAPDLGGGQKENARRARHAAGEGYQGGYGERANIKQSASNMYTAIGAAAPSGGNMANKRPFTRLSGASQPKTVYWQAPLAVPAPMEFKGAKREGAKIRTARVDAGTQQGALGETGLSDADIARAADKIYAKLEARLRTERRRFGL